VDWTKDGLEIYVDVGDAVDGRSMRSMRTCGLGAGVGGEDEWGLSSERTRWLCEIATQLFSAMLSLLRQEEQLRNIDCRASHWKIESRPYWFASQHHQAQD